MFLKNYTSDVPTSQTIHRIEQVLIRCGAAGITKEYATTAGEIEALSFQIETPNGKVSIRLPVDVQRAWGALWTDYANGEKLSDDGQRIQWNSRKKKVRADFKEQALRTAWKIMQDWVEVQMSMIQLKQAETLQVFLPYVISSSGETIYHRLANSGVAGLLPERAK
jgi:hypothetical protein